MYAIKVQPQLVVILVIFSTFLKSTYQITKTWKYSNNILNPVNWEGSAPSENCQGIIFPENLGSVGSIFQLTTKEVILPYSGEIEIREGGYLEISEQNNTCIRIKELKHHHWLNPKNWNTNQENSATPDAERVPCDHDDVVFSSDDGAPVAVFYPETAVSVNSIKIGGFSPSNEQWQNFLQTDYGTEQFNMIEEFDPGDILIKPLQCTNKSGCLCHQNYQETLDWICVHVKPSPDEPTCFKPITPTGFCHEICGGTIKLEIAENFNLDKFRQKIPKYDKVDSYISKVKKNGQDVVQIVFMDGSDYTEASADAASNFHSTLIRDLRSYKIKGATLEKSGVPIPKSTGWAGTFLLMFGTLTASLILSACIYALYIGPLENYNLKSRLPLAGVSFGTFKPFVFAKFENKEEGQISMAASMISLEKAFDNPMYGAHSSFASSSGGGEAVVNVVVATEAKPSTTSASVHKNPSYVDEEELKVIEDIGEGN